MTTAMARRTEYLRALVTSRTLAEREGVPVESVDLETMVDQGPDAEAVTSRLAAVLEDDRDRLLAETQADPRDQRRAMDILLREAGRVAKKLDADPTAAVSPGELVALEAVIRTDGTRPTLPVRNDAADADHPTAGDWVGVLATTREAMRPRLQAVGRIEPAEATSRSYFGTGWVVDSPRGLVLTNRHVVDAIWKRLSHRMLPTRTGFRIFDGVFIDFVAEAGRTRTNRFRVVEATTSGPDGPGFTRLDAAVLRVEPTPDGRQELPGAVPVLADVDAPRGDTGPFCVVGFPGPPAFTGGIHEGVDWTWVLTVLFGNRFGVKRLAPGLAHRPLGTFADDPRGWVFGHDATTLGGSSGSPLFAWLDPTAGAFGLHFAGASVETNFAHATGACVAELRALGVSVT